MVNGRVLGGITSILTVTVATTGLSGCPVILRRRDRACMHPRGVHSESWPGPAWHRHTGPSKWSAGPLPMQENPLQVPALYSSTCYLTFLGSPGGLPRCPDAALQHRRDLRARAFRGGQLGRVVRRLVHRRVQHGHPSLHRLERRRQRCVLPRRAACDKVVVLAGVVNDVKEAPGAAAVVPEPAGWDCRPVRRVRPSPVRGAADMTPTTSLSGHTISAPLPAEAYGGSCVASLHPSSPHRLEARPPGSPAISTAFVSLSL